MKIRWQRLSLWLIGILGFGSCDKIKDVIQDDPFIEPPMYGTPSADYIFEVKVTDEAGNPIPGIQVTPLSGETAEYAYPAGKPVMTDENGIVSGRINVFPDTFMVGIEDIDGEENGGTFAPETVGFKEFNFQQTEKPSGGWYDGAFTGKVTKVLRRSE